MRIVPVRLRSFSSRLWLSLVCATPSCLPAPRPASVARATEELQGLLDAHEYFALRERLASAREARQGLNDRYFQAFVEQAFNRPGRSNELIAAVMADPGSLSEASAFRLRQMEIGNHLRLHEYGQAGRKAAALLAAAPAPASASDRADLTNLVRLCRALTDVGAQRIESRAATHLQTERGNVPIRVGSGTVALGMDTGANLSMIMCSQAERLGLEIRPAGVEVSATTGAKATADVAIAHRLAIGDVVLAEVVFLAFPDSLLTFPDGSHVDGVLGFPVIDALGEVVRRGDGTVDIPSVPSTGGPENLTLADLDLLTVIDYRGHRLPCRLDTGARRTQLYEAFFRRFRPEVTRLGAPQTLRLSGVGGPRAFPGYRLPRVEIAVAGRPFVLRDVDVFTTTLKKSDEHLYCNLGTDILRQANAYRLNLRSMNLRFQD
jgi:hypothetical protein